MSLPSSSSSKPPVKGSELPTEETLEYIRSHLSDDPPTPPQNTEAVLDDVLAQLDSGLCVSNHFPDHDQPFFNFHAAHPDAALGSQLTVPEQSTSSSIEQSEKQLGAQGLSSGENTDTNTNPPSPGTLLPATKKSRKGKEPAPAPGSAAASQPSCDAMKQEDDAPGQPSSSASQFAAVDSDGAVYLICENNNAGRRMALNHALREGLINPSKKGDVQALYDVLNKVSANCNPGDENKWQRIRLAMDGGSSADVGEKETMDPAPAHPEVVKSGRLKGKARKEAKKAAKK